MERPPTTDPPSCSPAVMGTLVLVILSIGPLWPADGHRPAAPGAGAAQPAAPRRGGARLAATADPFDLLTSNSLLDLLRQLTAIEPHSGWRHSTTSGERLALRFVEQRLSHLAFLSSHGLQLERHPFRTFTGVEFWETRLELVVDGGTVAVPADGAPGHRDDLELALRFDSDGVVNDARRDPVTAEGAPLVIRSVAEIDSLPAADVAGRLVFLEYAVVDRSLLGSIEVSDRAERLLAKGPVGVAMVTSYSNRVRQSHGAFAGDLNAFTWVGTAPRVPVLSVRMEDIEDAGVDGWEELSSLQRARLVWDVDVFAPGSSEDLVARIPGADSSRAIILGAHIDSPNSPGALDDGSGAVTLLEAARLLDRSRTTPPLDLYLVWFGSEERGLYGSQSFVNAHSELLDRTVAMLQMDCLGHPLDGRGNRIALEAWSYGSFGDRRSPWPDALTWGAIDRGVTALPVDYAGLGSDNSSFGGFDVPNANMIYMDPYSDLEVHYANHLHDPYDTVDLAEAEADALEDMARVVLLAALDPAPDLRAYRVTPAPDRRALFVASHTESPHMTPASFIELGMALAWEGFDVDTVPYGRAVGDADLAGADLVVALPVHDYPVPEDDSAPYDEAWTQPEVEAIERWTSAGGTLLITNSAHRLKYLNWVFEENEDWGDQNALAAPFGVQFVPGYLGGTEATTTGSHRLVRDVAAISMARDNAVRFEVTGGEVLARVGERPVLAVLDHGAGRVVVMADVGMLGNDGGEPRNLVLWRNLARFAR